MAGKKASHPRRQQCSHSALFSYNTMPFPQTENSTAKVQQYWLLALAFYVRTLPGIPWRFRSDIQFLQVNAGIIHQTWLGHGRFFPDSFKFIKHEPSSHSRRYWQRRTDTHSWNVIFCIPIKANGARGGAVGWGTALQAGRSRIRFPMLSLEFFIDIIVPAALWP
jgi:hypothetical protein